MFLFSSPLQITYSLASGLGDAPEFTINSQTGAIITTKPLDRELQAGYLLTVTAKDGGMPALSDTTDVEISVSDINDNAPTFLKSSYTGTVSEDSLVGTSVLQVSATDVDTGLNSRIRYALKEEVGAFVIDATSGVIRTATPLDRESIPTYEIHALAIDRGTPPMSSSVSYQKESGRGPKNVLLMFTFTFVLRAFRCWLPYDWRM